MPTDDINDIDDIDPDEIVSSARNDCSCIGWAPEAVLLALILRHVDSAGITWGHLCDLADEIVRRAGGVEAGIKALEGGSLHLDRVDEG